MIFQSIMVSVSVEFSGIFSSKNYFGLLIKKKTSDEYFSKPPFYFLENGCYIINGGS